MVKEKKGLLGFADSGDTDKNITIDSDNTSNDNNVLDSVENNINDNENDIDNNSENISSVDDIFNSVINKKKAVKKKQLNIYIDPDIAKKLDKLAEKHGKGFKSELINNFLKAYFQK